MIDVRYYLYIIFYHILSRQDSEDYRSLLIQYQLVLQQLEASQKEIRTIREQSEKFQREILVIRSQSESGSSAIKFELESSKREVARLTQIIESLRVELESSKKQASEVNFVLFNVRIGSLVLYTSNRMYTNRLH